MARNFDQEAHNKGECDSSTSRSRGDSADIIWDSLFGGSYNPPKGHEEAYKSGWDNDQKQSK